MSSTRHKWSEKTRADDGRSSRRVCTRCELIAVSRHERDERGFPLHWKEYFRGTELVARAPAHVPICEPILDQVPA